MQLVAGEVGVRPDVLGVDEGAHQAHVGLDGGQPERAVHRDAVVAVADEVHVADPVDVDRRQRLAPPGGLGDPLPALAVAAGAGAELRVEVAHLVERSHDPVDGDDLQPERNLVDQAERLDDLLERQRLAVAALLEQYPGAERGDHLQAAGPQEVRLGVGPRGAGVTKHGGHPR